MPMHDGKIPRGGPWSHGSKPPDLKDLIQQLLSRFKQIMPRSGPSGVFVVALVALGAWTSVYTVPRDSVAVVQRFGQYVKYVPPGLHFKLPLGVDVATIVPIKRQLKQGFGFTIPGARDPYQSPRDGKRETKMVTGDLNAALVKWAVLYRISESVIYLFEMHEPRETLRYVSESVMGQVVGYRTDDSTVPVQHSLDMR